MGWLASLGREKGHAKWLIPLATLQERFYPPARHDFRQSGGSPARTS
jgi:hypothetical protein